MAESLDALRKMVIGEVRKKREILEAQNRRNPARGLGEFIETTLNNLKMSREQFAQELDIEPLLADGLLNGFLPASEIDDDFLVDIATVIGHEPNTLRIFLGRGIVPTVDLSDDPAGDNAARA
jgi:hypothetical protein